MRRASVLALGIVAIGAAVVLALLGNAVLGVAQDTKQQDETLAFGAGRPDATPHERGLQARVGEAILGVADDRAYRDAAELAKAAGLEKRASGAADQRRAEAEAILVAILRGEDDRVLRSRAANLLGVLLFEDAKVARENPRRYLEQSLGALQDAVTLDPGFDVAKANLEVVATLPPNTSFREIGTTGDEASSSGVPGTGY